MTCKPRSISPAVWLWSDWYDSTMAEHRLNDIASLIVYQANLGEQVCHSVRYWIRDWNADHGIERSYGDPTRNDNGSYDSRRAVKILRAWCQKREASAKGNPAVSPIGRHLKEGTACFGESSGVV